MHNFFEIQKTLILMLVIAHVLQCENREALFYENDSVTVGEIGSFTDISTHAQDITDIFPFVENKTELNNFSFNEVENITEFSTETHAIANETDTTTAITERVFAENIGSISHWQDDICTCDLLPFSCDVNCCCDQDCSEWDIRAFPQCINEEAEVDRQYCFSSDVIYNNNTPYKKIALEADGLFCIVHDNFKERMKFKELPAFQSIEEFHKLFKPVYSWDQHNEGNELEPSELMKAGDPIFVTNRPSISELQVKWRIPSQCFTDMCDCTKEVVYMEDFKTSCTHIIHNISTECEEKSLFSATAFEELCVLRYHKNATNISMSWQESEDIRITENTSNSEEKTSDFKCVSSHNSAKPKYDHSSKICTNVVAGVSYIIQHDGIYGITNISAKFIFLNITNAATSFHQQFSINFVWNNANNTVKRSGNPGYRVGYPILTGQYVGHREEFDTLLPTIEKDSHGLTILKSSESGLCSTARNYVLFGKNMKSGCYLNIKSNINVDTCAELQDNIMKFLKGSVNETTYIGSFGNANANNSGDWSEIFHENSVELSQSESTSVCQGITTGLKIYIAYAAVGSLYNPQNKILGVVFHYFGAQTVHLKCDSIYCPIVSGNTSYLSGVYLSTSVTFYDISEMAIPAYSRIPVLKVKLPHDFFYPFLLSKATKSLYSWFSIFSCITFLFLRYINMI